MTEWLPDQAQRPDQRVRTGRGAACPFGARNHTTHRYGPAAEARNENNCTAKAESGCSIIQRAAKKRVIFDTMIAKTQARLVTADAQLPRAAIRFARTQTCPAVPSNASWQSAEVPPRERPL
jgi:hypothetical protein